jgi:hypothetical protein
MKKRGIQNQYVPIPLTQLAIPTYFYCVEFPAVVTAASSVS